MTNIKPDEEESPMQVIRMLKEEIATLKVERDAHLRAATEMYAEIATLKAERDSLVHGSVQWEDQVDLKLQEIATLKAKNEALRANAFNLEGKHNAVIAKLERIVKEELTK